MDDKFKIGKLSVKVDIRKELLEDDALINSGLSISQTLSDTMAERFRNRIETELIYGHKHMSIATAYGMGKFRLSEEEKKKLEIFNELGDDDE